MKGPPKCSREISHMCGFLDHPWPYMEGWHQLRPYQQDSKPSRRRGRETRAATCTGFPSRQIDMHEKKWLNQTKYGLHGQPAINSWFPHVVPPKKSSWLHISDRWGDGSSSIACRLGPAGAGGDCHWQDRCDPTWSVLENGCLGVNGNPLV